MYSGDSQPKGINIPNYGQIRDKEGFKNVIFEENQSQNKSLWDTLNFMTKAESDMINENSTNAYRVMVAGHELFGHGSGKLIFRGKDGQCPMTFTDPINNETFTQCYDLGGVDYKTKFGEISSSYEECRADLSGLYLSTLANLYQRFDYKESEVKDLLWLNTMIEIRKGIYGLASAYNPKTGKWKQAHAQGAWVITQWILRN